MVEVDVLEHTDGGSRFTVCKRTCLSTSFNSLTNGFSSSFITALSLPSLSFQLIRSVPSSFIFLAMAALAAALISFTRAIFSSASPPIMFASIVAIDGRYGGGGEAISRHEHCARSPGDHPTHRPPISTNHDRDPALLPDLVPDITKTCHGWPRVASRR